MSARNEKSSTRRLKPEEMDPYVGVELGDCQIVKRLGRVNDECWPRHAAFIVVQADDELLNFREREPAGLFPSCARVFEVRPQRAEDLFALARR